MDEKRAGPRFRVCLTDSSLQPTESGSRRPVLKRTDLESLYIGAIGDIGDIFSGRNLIQPSSLQSEGDAQHHYASHASEFCGPVIAFTHREAARKALLGDIELSRVSNNKSRRYISLQKGSNCGSVPHEKSAYYLPPGK